MKVKFIHGKIRIRADQNLALPKPEHPYGSEAHTLNFASMDENGQYTPLGVVSPNTPEWDHADGLVNKHFGGKLGLHDLAKSYSIPGMQNQNLSLTLRQPNQYQPHPSTSISADYLGESKNGKNFGFDLTHGRDDHNNHSIYWNNMNNQDKSEPHLMSLMSQSLPLAQKGDIKNIDTTASSDRNGMMNGGHTWANLGFGFKDSSYLPFVKNNLNGMLSRLRGKTGESTKDIENQVNSATHPFQLKDAARLTALAHRRAYKNENDMTKYEEPLSAHHAWNQATTGDRWAGATFEGRLNLDPNDIGYQRMMRFMQHHRNGAPVAEEGNT